MYIQICNLQPPNLSWILWRVDSVKSFCAEKYSDEDVTTVTLLEKSE